MQKPEGGMDQITAHLDRGWSLISRKDYSGAGLSAREVLSLDPENPEGFTLLGLAALGEQDLDEALDAFETAQELDPGYLAPIVYAAEALASDPERLPEAIERLEDAYSLVTPDSPEYVDAVLLHVDLLLERGDEKAARTRLSQLTPEAVGLIDQQVHAAKLALRLEDISRAEEMLAPVASRDDLPADALYACAQVAERRGRLDEALRLFLLVREAYAASLPQADLPTEEQSLALCREAITALDEEESSVVSEAEIRVRDLPAEELVADGLDPWMPLLVTGLPEDPDGEPSKPQALHIFVYRSNLRFETEERDRWVEQLAEYLSDSIERFIEAG